jgi:hypothetical protein
VGYKTITNLKTGIETRRHWHFGIDALPFTHPKILFMVRATSCSLMMVERFGTTTRSFSPPRAGQRKNWWNPAWRDRLLGTTAMPNPSRCRSEVRTQ